MERRNFDIQFRIGPISVAIEPSFWLAALLLGLLATPGRAEIEAGSGLASIMAVVLASILLHELGHALTSHLLGVRARVRLYAFGGLTFTERPLPPGTQALVWLAGPAFSVVAGGAALALRLVGQPAPGLLDFTLQHLYWINFGWAAINLIPVVPLDAGHALLGILGPQRQPLALLIGGVSAALAAVAAGLAGLFFVSALFVLLGMRNFQARALAREAAESEAQIGEALGRGWRALAQGNEQEAGRVGRFVLENAADPEGRNRARDLLAWAALAEGERHEALRHLERSEPPEGARALSWALVLESLGDAAGALPYALEALKAEPSETSARLAFGLLLAEGRHDEARLLAERFAWPRPGARDAAVGEVEFAARRFEQAAARFESAFGASGRAEDAYRAAQGHARAGANDQALTWLERALGAGLENRGRILADPELELVRSDPRLAALVEGEAKAVS